MDKSNPPRSMGVFKPAGHTVIAFRTADAMEAAAHTLVEQGIDSTEMARYSPKEMLAQVESDLQTAGPLASVGQELNLVKAHGELAKAGCSFLVVHGTDDKTEKLVDAVILTYAAAAAQRYGTFMVEELTKDARDDAQVFESPDRGLDLHVRDTLNR